MSLKQGNKPTDSAGFFGKQVESESGVSYLPYLWIGPKLDAAVPQEFILPSRS